MDSLQAGQFPLKDCGHLSCYAGNDKKWNDDKWGRIDNRIFDNVIPAIF